MTVAEKKLTRKRLSALELAEKLGNVSEACRRRGVSRIQFYRVTISPVISCSPLHHHHTTLNLK